jgi:hypothetical protein
MSVTMSQMEIKENDEIQVKQSLSQIHSTNTLELSRPYVRRENFI